MEVEVPVDVGVPRKVEIPVEVKDSGGGRDSGMRQAKAEIAVEVDCGGGRGSRRAVRLGGELISSRAEIISYTAVRINAASKIELQFLASIYQNPLVCVFG